MTKSHSRTQAMPDEDHCRGETLFSAFPHPLFLIDPKGALAQMNPSAESFIALPARACLGKSLAAVFGDNLLLQHLIDTTRATRRPYFAHDVEISLQSATGAPRAVPADLELFLLTESADVALLVRERKQASRLKQRHQAKAPALGVSTLARMMAHEVKNPLAAIRGTAQLLESILPDDELDLARLLDHEARRIQRLTEQVDLFNDDASIRRELTNIHDVLDNALDSVDATFLKMVRFQKNYDPSLPDINADRDQLVQAFVNLLKNAAEAVRNQEKDTTGVVTITSAYRAGLSVIGRDGKSKIDVPIEVQIADTGPGLHQEIASMIFEPFVSSKAGGRGLGLAFVAKAISDHGGLVEAERRDGQTRFTVALPVARGQKQGHPS